ncbi:MAG: hypothetical protein ISQ13_01720 [Candidatus Margulisbacteria bacterium]|nr:hypothetical protein [Candidatus Margulisiibacteriota bacterium]
MYRVEGKKCNNRWPGKALRLATKIGLLLGNIASTTPSNSIQTSAAIETTIKTHKNEIATYLTTGKPLPNNISIDETDVLMKFINYKNGNFNIAPQIIDMGGTQEMHVTDQFYINAKLVNIPKDVMFSNCIFLSCQLENTQTITMLNCDIRGSSFTNSNIDFSQFHGINAEGAIFENTTIVFDPYNHQQPSVPMYWIDKKLPHERQSTHKHTQSVYKGASFTGAEIFVKDGLTKTNQMLCLNLAGSVIVDQQRKPLVTIPEPAGDPAKLYPTFTETNRVYAHFGLPNLVPCPPNNPGSDTHQSMEPHTGAHFINSFKQTVQSVFGKIPTGNKVPLICLKEPQELPSNNSLLVYKPENTAMNAYVQYLHGQTIDGILNKGTRVITFMTPIEVNPSLTYAYFGAFVNVDDVFNHELLHVFGVPHPNFNAMYEQHASNLPPRLLSIMMYLYNGGFPIKMGLGPMDAKALADIFNLSPPDNMILSTEGMDPKVTQALDGQSFMHSPDCGKMEVSNTTHELKLLNISECLDRDVYLNKLYADLFLKTLSGKSHLRKKTTDKSEEISRMALTPIESYHLIFPSIRDDLERALSSIADQIDAFMVHSYFDYYQTKESYGINTTTVQGLGSLIHHIESQYEFFKKNNAVTDLFIEFKIGNQYFKITFHFNPVIIEKQKKRNGILNITFTDLFEPNNFKNLQENLATHKPTTPPPSHTSPTDSNPTTPSPSHTSPTDSNPTPPPSSHTSPTASKPTPPPPSNTSPTDSNPTPPPSSHTSPTASKPTPPPPSDTSPTASKPTPPPPSNTSPTDSNPTTPPPSDPKKSNTTFIILMSSFIGGGSLLCGLTFICIYCRNIKKNLSYEGTEMEEFPNTA